MIPKKFKVEYDLERDDWLFEEPPSKYDSNRDFVSLKAWQKCRELKIFFYKEVLPQLPPEERYDLSSQIRRAANSTTLNIAEGYGRYHKKESIQFYRISRGSLYELKDALISCVDLTYIEKTTYNKGIKLIEEAKIRLNGYIKYIQNQ